MLNPDLATVLRKHCIIVPCESSQVESRAVEVVSVNSIFNILHVNHILIKFMRGKKLDSKKNEEELCFRLELITLSPSKLKKTVYVASTTMQLSL